MSGILRSQRAQAFLGGDAAESLECLGVVVTAVNHHVERQAIGVRGIARPRDDRSLGGAALGKQRILPRLRAPPFYDRHGVAKLALHSIDHATCARPKLRCDRGQRGVAGGDGGVHPTRRECGVHSGKFSRRRGGRGQIGHACGFADVGLARVAGFSEQSQGRGGLGVIADGGQAGQA